MRLILGIIGIVAAAIFITFQSILFYMIGVDMTSVEWMQEYYGAFAAGVVVFEAILLVFVLQLWRDRKKMMACAAAILLAAATLYTLRLELRYNVGGQADKLAERSLKSQTIELDLKEKAKLLEQKSAWAARIEAEKLGPQTTRAINDAIAQADARIEAIERRLLSTGAVASPMPEASWLARVVGIGSEADWTDWLQALPILFSALMRTFCLAIVVESLRWVREPQRQAAQPDAPAAKEFVPEPSQPVSEPITVQEEADTAQVREGNIIPYPAKNLPVLESGSDVVEYAVNLMPADGFKMDELMAEIREICGKHDLPTPDPRSVGVALSRLGYESLRPRLYQKKDGGGLAQVRAA